MKNTEDNEQNEGKRGFRLDKKNCYECEFCIDKNTKYPACGLTEYAGGYVSLILMDPKKGVKTPCPLNTGRITTEAYKKYEKELEKEEFKEAKYEEEMS